MVALGVLIVPDLFTVTVQGERSTRRCSVDVHRDSMRPAASEHVPPRFPFTLVWNPEGYVRFAIAETSTSFRIPVQTQIDRTNKHTPSAPIPDIAEGEPSMSISDLHTDSWEHDYPITSRNTPPSCSYNVCDLRHELSALPTTSSIAGERDTFSL